MAIWQFGFSIVPEKALLQKNIGELYNVNPENFDEIISWNGYGLSEPSIEKISKTLEQNQSWSDNIKQFGLLEKTCIELFYEENRLMEVSIRLDLRDLTLDVLVAVVDFVKDNNALILTPKGVLLRPTVEDVIEEIKKSNAYSFIKNPYGFIASTNN
ncbi:hypothetical protein [Anaerosolibacter sp.]|uniref:hypothetical protein n=1 Tax=Anaerosolibacter sp. TaxID=1872527 RepID=UPI0039F05707